jgi:hypothetical protein
MIRNLASSVIPTNSYPQRAVTAAVTAAHRRAPLQAIAQAQPNPSLNNAQSQMAFAKPQKPSGGGGGAPSSERGFTSKPMRY